MTKKQLAVELQRSARWIELRVNEGMPCENLDRYGRRMFDLAAVEAWLAGGKPKPATIAERLAVVEGELASLRAQIGELTRRAS